MVVSGAASVQAQTAQSPHEAHDLHADPAAYIAALEDPKRDAWQKPREVIAALDLRPGELPSEVAVDGEVAAGPLGNETADETANVICIDEHDDCGN